MTSIPNPYYEEGKEHFECNHNRDFNKSFNTYHLRWKLIPKYSFAVPNQEALDEIKNLGVKIIEIGAGSGYWAHMLSQNGVDIICFDTYQTKYSHGEWEKKWFNIENGGPEKIREYPDRALFLCWPDYCSPMASDCLKEYKGEYVIYIGESDGGCTADGEFFKIIEREFEEVKVIPIPQWYGIHDYIYIYKRRNFSGMFDMIEVE